MKRPVRIAIMGWYGNNNAGDEAVLAGILTQLSKRFGNVRAAVFSDNPSMTASMHCVDSLWSLPGTWDEAAGPAPLWRMGRVLGPGILELIRSDLCIIGGGGIFADHSFRTIRRWCFRAKMAHRLSKKAVVYGVGVEPLKRPESRGLVRHSLGCLPMVSVRDEESAGVLARCGLKNNVVISSDPAFAIEPSEASVEPGLIRRMMGTIVICPVGRYRGDVAKQYGTLLAAGVARFVLKADKSTHGEAGKPALRVVVGAMMPGDEAIAAYFNNVPGFDGTLPLYEHRPEAVAGMLGRARMVVGSRLHSLILASLSLVPAVAVIYDQKVKSLIRRLGIESASVSYGDGSVWPQCCFEPQELAAAMRLADSGAIRCKRETLQHIKMLNDRQIDALTQIAGLSGRERSPDIASRLMAPLPKANEYRMPL